MLYAIIAYDKSDMADTRAATRPDHLAYLASAGDKLCFAGPLLSEDSEPKPIGSIIVMEAASLDAVKLMAHNDPYTKAGLFESVKIHPWKGVTGSWVPADA